jgi:hypothetical protein
MGDEATRVSARIGCSGNFLSPVCIFLSKARRGRYQHVFEIELLPVYQEARLAQACQELLSRSHTEAPALSFAEVAGQTRGLALLQQTATWLYRHLGRFHLEQRGLEKYARKVIQPGFVDLHVWHLLIPIAATISSTLSYMLPKSHDLVCLIVIS